MVYFIKKIIFFLSKSNRPDDLTDYPITVKLAGRYDF